MSHHVEVGHNRSAWEETSRLPEPAALRENTTADVCVVGAGIAGITCAYRLAREGASVVVLDRGPLLVGETKHTTAHLSCVLDDRFSMLESLRGPEASRLAAEAHATAIQLIENVTVRERIDCDFERVDGFLFPADEADVPVIDRELAAARRAGLEVIPTDESPPGTRFLGPMLRFTGMAQFHPLRYLNGLIARCRQLGVRFHSHTPVVTVDGGPRPQVRTSGGATVDCGAAIVATNSPVNERFALHTKLYPYRTFVVTALVPRGSVAPGLFWDTAEPYHYVRTQPWNDSHDLLIVGGEDHKTAHADDAEKRYDSLETWTRRHFPAATGFLHRWTGQVLETLDGLAYLGREPSGDENVYVATGDSGMGITHGTIAGLLIPDLIQGRANPWTELFDPARKVPKRTSEFLRENLDVASQFRKFLTPGEIADLADLAPGCGAVMRHGLTKHAVYRAPDGTVHRMSAVCPHLGCLVAWNSATATWDCPCHGSRFDPEGHVLTGPACSGLKPVGSAPATDSTASF